MTYGVVPSYPTPGAARPNERVSPGVLIGVSLWRLLIIIFAFTGLLLALDGKISRLEGLSQAASLLTGIVYIVLLLYPLFTGGRRHEPANPWLRGAVTVTLMLVGVTFMTLMGGDLDEAWSLFEHLLTPLVVLIDWIAVGRSQVRARWWYPLTWIAFPLVYLLYYNAAGVQLYKRSFPLRFGAESFFGYFVGFLIGIIACGFLLLGIAKLKGMISLSGTGTPAQPYPGPYPPAPTGMPQAQFGQPGPVPQVPPAPPGAVPSMPPGAVPSMPPGAPAPLPHPQGQPQQPPFPPGRPGMPGPHPTAAPPGHPTGR